MEGKILKHSYLKEGECEICKISILKRAANQKYCKPCKRQVILKYKRDSELRKRVVLGRKVKGSTIACDLCKVQMVKVGINQLYCESCSKIKLKLNASISNLKYLSKSNYDPEVRRKYMRKYLKNRYDNEPNFALKIRIVASISQSIRFKCNNVNYKERRSKGNLRWTQVLGWTIVELCEHLERNFKDGMSWDNRNLWHIDHIKPLSSFNFHSVLCPEFKQAWSLSNLQPLWAIDNLVKSNKYES